MKTILIAFGLGVITEALLAILGFAGGWGPCGPGSIGGVFWYFLHTPGFALMRSLELKEPGSLFIIFALYSILWAGFWHAGLRRKFAKQNTQP